MAARGRRQGGPSQLRIIGGQWRGRRLEFTPIPGLRPTGDRLRETLFNWLAPILPEARCADLFAGSGALGLEALSRGAAHCHFVEPSKVAAGHISKHLHTLKASSLADCHREEAATFISRADCALDIVFLDPPFGSGLADPVCKLLEARALLAPDARVYLESARTEPPPALPDHWQLYREKSTGEVCCRLYRVEMPVTSPIVEPGEIG